MSHAALAHAVNGFFDSFKSKPAVAARPASRAAQVRVGSRYNEGDDESLLESATSLPRPTLKALEKAIRADGFKGAQVSGWSQGQRGGFTVHYGGEQHEFEISENTTPRPVGEIGRLVKASGRYAENGRRTGILSDGTRVNVYRYQGAGDEWTAALHYPDGGYSALTLMGRAAEFDEHNLEGPHMGTLISWEAVPGNIKRDIEQRAVEASMVANGRFKMVRTSPDPGRAGMHKYGPATVWVSGPVSGTWWATVKFRSQEKDLDAKSYEAVLQEAADWIDGAPELSRNGRGIYHETAVAKNDMVIHQDHRGRWRIDLVTSAGGNHIDVTGRSQGYGTNTGYSSAEDAFQAALDVQRVRGIRGKSHVWIADRDGGLTDYEPMERNGRNSAQDAEAAFYYNERKIADAEEELRRPGISAAYRQQMRDLIESSRSEMEYARRGMEPNGRATTVDPVAARELDLYIANTYELIGAPNSIGKSIDANLRRKLASGKYDPALAPKAWQYLVDEGAKRYQKEFGSDSPIFNAATRRQVAVDFSSAWEAENGQ